MKRGRLDGMRRQRLDGGTLNAPAVLLGVCACTEWRLFGLMYAVLYRSHMRAYNRVHIYVVYCLYTGWGVRIHGGGVMYARRLCIRSITLPSVCMCV